MSDESLKLTVYFGERQRVGRRYVADELLDLIGGHEIATSILLRGVAGFGQRHRLRSDLSLTLAEDPPMVAIAVDARERVEPLLTELTSMPCRGLVTLERTRILPAPLGAVVLPAELQEAAKLTLYLGRHEQVRGAPAFVAACELLHRRGLAGASVFVGVDGTMRGRRQRARFFDRNSGVPTMVVAVGPGDRLAAVVPELGALLQHPASTLERVRICKRDGTTLERPHPLPAADSQGRPLFQKLTVYSSESYLVDQEPIHRAIVRRLQGSAAASGASVLRGCWGFHGDHAPHGDRLLQLGRRVPVATIVVDSTERIAAIYDVMDELTREHGLVTVEMVPAMRAMAGDDPHRAPMRLAHFRFR